MSESPSHVSWYLEGFADEERRIWRTAIDRFPFRVGRNRGANLRLNSPKASHLHAEFVLAAGRLVLHDLNSTNGTFVDTQKVTMPLRVEDGAIIHFANLEFRLVCCAEEGPISHTSQTLAMGQDDLPVNLLRRVHDYRSMIEEQRLFSVFQPLVDLSNQQLIGYEALGRGMLAGVETSPVDLFMLAECLDSEDQLSRAMRAVAVAGAQQLEDARELFVNTHPAELRDGVEVLLRSLEELSKSPFAGRLVLEIHEGAVAERSAMTALAAGLAELGIEIAFDDFGTGQARLLELAEVAPRYVKFDRAWVQDLPTASAPRVEMVERLVTMVRGLGISTLAEGVETAEEAAMCRDLGFEYAQGYHFGRPSPPEVWNAG